MRRLIFTAWLAVTACGQGERPAKAPAAGNDSIAAAEPTSVSATAPSGAAVTAQGDTLAPNELGRIPILEYHLIGDSATRWTRARAQFRKDLDTLYARGFRPVNLVDVLDKKIDLPRGLSPVVFVFDDASPSQFSYIERHGKLEIDPNSVVGIWQNFAKRHPDWRNKAVFCVLSGAEAGRSFFGDKGIAGQKSEWRFQKVKYLADQGFEICNHTLWHAQLSKYPDAFVQQQIAQLQLAVDSAIPGYQIRTLALPLGLWPKNRVLAYTGSWTDAKSQRTINYHYDAVLEVAGGAARSPYDPEFNARALPRLQVVGNELLRVVDQLDKAKNRYVSDGDPGSVATVD